MKVNIGKYKKNGERKSSITIDKEDLYNLDTTLALIILPALKEYKNNCISYGYVENSDVPVELQSELDPFAQPIKLRTARFIYILDEMIFAFEHILKEDESPSYYDENIHNRINNGLRLFGYYYRSLWI